MGRDSIFYVSLSSIDLKKLLSKESVNAKEFQEIIILDNVMKNENMCGVPDKKKKQKKSIAHLKKELFGG